MGPNMIAPLVPLLDSGDSIGIMLLRPVFAIGVSIAGVGVQDLHKDDAVTLVVAFNPYEGDT